MDTYRNGELWVRLGIDGVPLWKIHVVATTLSMCGDLHGYPEHSSKRHFVIRLFRGYDTIDGLRSVLEGIKLDTALAELDKQHINLPNGQTLRVRVFPMGDHMLQYKVSGRDGPTSTKPERHPCPYCDAPAPEVAMYAAAPRPYAKSSSALFQSTPVEQHATDVAHGVVNVTYTVELPLLENCLVDKSGLSRTEWLAMYANVAADCGVPSTADDELRNVSSQTDYLERSISNAVSFFMEAKYLSILTVVDIKDKGFTRDYQGQPVAVPKLLRAMFEHSRTMVKVACTAPPKVKDITDFVSAAKHLRSVLHALGASGTVWGRVWTCDTPQCFVRWGTLYPFL